MGEEWFKSCLPKEYFEQFIQEGIYNDGRSTSVFNPLFLKLGSWGGVGSALIKQGGVAVSCVVQGSLALSHSGSLVNCEVDACASVSQAEISDVTDMLSNILSNEALCIRSALHVSGTDDALSMTWELTLQVQILNSDGPIFDAVVCAASAALFNVRLPSVNLAHAKDDESPIQREEISILNETKPLDLKAFPVSVSFHIFKGRGRDYLLVDPPQDIIDQCDARVSFVTDGRNVLFLRTRGILKDDSLFSKMSALAERRHQSIMDAIRKDCGV